MSDDEVFEAYAELRSLFTNVIGFQDLADEHYRNDSIGQLKANAYVYAGGQVLAWRVLSLSQRIDEWGDYPVLADALRPLRQLCADIIGANAWVDDAALPEDERLLFHAQAYANGYELARHIIQIDRGLAGENRS